MMGERKKGKLGLNYYPALPYKMWRLFLRGCRSSSLIAERGLITERNEGRDACNRSPLAAARRDPSSAALPTAAAVQDSTALRAAEMSSRRLVDMRKDSLGCRTADEAGEFLRPGSCAAALQTWPPSEPTKHPSSALAAWALVPAKVRFAEPPINTLLLLLTARASRKSSTSNLQSNVPQQR